jgi:hypothetical protein
MAMPNVLDEILINNFGTQFDVVGNQQEMSENGRI